MFAWYRGSVVCYFFLFDVPGRQLRDSRWITRGWTLQELVAPVDMRSCDCRWKLLGTKDGLLSQLCDITRIDRSVLCGGSLRLVSVA